MIFKKFILLFIVLLLSNIQTIAQLSNLINIKGLPSKEVYQVLVDRKGFVWVGHELGLNRYDGVKFENYTNPKQISISISNILEDEDGRIWGINFSGQVLYVEDNQLRILDAYDYKKERNYPKISLFNKEILISSDHGIFICNPRTKKCDFLNKLSNNETIGKISAHTPLSDGVIMQGNDSWYMYHKNKSIKKLLTDSRLIDVKHTTLLSKSHDDTIFFYNNMQLISAILKKDSIVVTNILKTKEPVIGISFTNKHKWIHTRGKTYGENNDVLVNEDAITSVCNDNEGNYWITSVKSGLFLIRKTQEWKPIQLLKDSTDYIKAYIKLPIGTIIGTFKGNVLIKNTANSIVFQQKLENEDYGIDKIEMIDSLHYIIIGSNNIYLFDLNSLKIYKKLRFITAKGFDKNDTHLFITNVFGAFVIDKQSFIKNSDTLTYGIIKDISNYYTFKSNTVNSNVDYKIRARAITYLPESNSFLIAFKIGLFELNNQVIKPVSYQNEPIYANQLAYANGKVWIGSMSAGLFVRYNKEYRSLINVLSPDDKTILKIKTVQNRVWVTTIKNVYCFNNISEKVIKLFKLSEINGADIIDIFEDGNHVCFLTKNGIYKERWENEKNISIRPLNYLLYATVNYTDTLKNNRILSKNKNNIQFYLAGLWYSNPEKLLFKYKLSRNNSNEKWQTTSYLQRSVFFNNLTPGEYVFEAYAETEDGVNAAQKIVFPFIIKKAFWESWWFTTVIFLIIIALVFFFLKWRIDINNRRNKLEIEKVQLEVDLRNSMLAAMKSQLNPHFIFNALNTIQSYIYANERKKAISYLGKFSNLIRIILYASNKKLISLAEEIEMLELYISLEEMRFEDNFSYIFYVDNTLTRDSILIPPMLVQPYIENAIKHGLLHKAFDRKLKVAFQKTVDDEWIEIIIEDNGVGIEKSKELNDRKNAGLGISTYVNEKRVDIINQTLANKIVIEYIDKGQATKGKETGTIVKILIPVDMDEYR